SMLSYLPSSIIKSIVDFDSKIFDIINSHFAIPSGPSGWILSKMFCLPNVLSIHGGDIFDPSKSLSPHNTPVLSDTVRLMLKTADRVVAQSSNTKSNAGRYYKVDRPIDIIPLGIKKPVFERKSRADFGLSEDDFIFCTIGRLVKRKNIDETLQVLSGLDQDLRVKLLVMGDGPQYAHISDLARQRGLHEKVVMLGNVSDEMKFQLLSVSDCYISTAMHEGFGLVFLEAMECGLPVICYDFGGQTDFLINGKTGFLVELGNMQKLHQRVIEIMNNREVRKKMGNFNRQLVCNFYIERCADQYITLFEQLIHDSGKERKRLI
ncbi:MAG: glycosyltransferase family 4 protein, partial [Desulfobacterales bacterium]|nr:glycosyltransferase family 4 protein [Desulfobacterales bacterium]